MNWKEFLKPTNIKLIITMIIYSLGIIAIVSSFQFAGYSLSLDQIYLWRPLSQILLTYWVYTGEIEPLALRAILLPLQFIYVYVLASLIVWIYNKKLKKAKRK